MTEINEEVTKAIHRLREHISMLDRKSKYGQPDSVRRDVELLCNHIEATQPQPTTEDWSVHPTQRAVFIRSFAKAIEHGDNKHKQWLRDAAESYIKHGTVPPHPCPCEIESELKEAK